MGSMYLDRLIPVFQNLLSPRQFNAQVCILTLIQLAKKIKIKSRNHIS